MTFLSTVYPQPYTFYLPCVNAESELERQPELHLEDDVAQARKHG